MLVCPNPECKFAVRHGRPAEYRESFTTCSDCGAALVAASAVPPPVPAAAAKPPAVGAPLTPVLVTLGLFAAMAAASFVKLIEVEGSPGFLGSFNRPTWMPPTSIGLNPFLSSFMIVEVIALIPALNARRVGTFEQRRPLVLASVLLGVVLLGIQCVSITLWLRSTESMMRPLPIPALATTAVMAVTSLLLLGATRLIDRYGVGNGFAVAIAALSLSELSTASSKAYQWLRTDALSMPGLLIFIAVLAAVAALTVRLTAPPRSASDQPTWRPMPASTVQPVSAAAALLSLPATFGLAFARQLQSSVYLYNGVFAVLIAGIGSLLAWLFFRPEQMAAMWKLWRPERDEAPHRAWAATQLPWVLGTSFAFCAGLAIAPSVIANLINVPLYISLTVLALLAAIVADVYDEARARNQLGPLTAIRPLSRLTELEPALAALGAANIPAFPRAGRYRVLLGFFAPYAPVTLLVPDSRAEEARKILER